MQGSWRSCDELVEASKFSKEFERFLNLGGNHIVTQMT